MRILRTLAAVFGGYAIFAILAQLLFRVAGRAPHAPQPLWFMALATVAGMAFAALGGAFAARVAPVRPAVHAIAVADLIALGATVSIFLSGGDGSHWSQWAALLLMTPSAWLGGRLAAGERRGAAPLAAD